ncbi:MAG: hypothetical protein ACP5VQ_04035 [Phycisphaerae bacterium]
MNDTKPSNMFYRRRGQPVSHPIPQRTAKWLVEEITRRNEKIRDFWSDHHGWAPPRAAEILNRARLDRQVSLSKCLSIWLDSLPELAPQPRPYPWQTPGTQVEDLGHSDGRLILAWANLGSLVEGTMKFGLSVFANEYDATPVTRGKKKTPLDPDVLELEYLKQFYNQHFWIELQKPRCKQEARWKQKTRWNKFVELVQKRRNAIHSYRDHDIGDWREFYVAVKNYLVLLSVIEGRMSYPDELPTEY